MPAAHLQRRFLLLHPSGRWVLPLLAFCIIVAASLAFAHRLHQENLDEARVRFSMDAALVTVEIRDRLRHHAQFLQGLRAFISSMPEVRQADWLRFSSFQDPRTQLQGVQAFGYLPAVPAQALSRFEAHARKLLNLPEYQVFPPGRLEPRFPVLFVSPSEGSNLRGLGYDLGSEPARKEAMDEARDRDSVAMSRRLQLILDQPEQSRPGFVLFLPIYANDLPTSTVEERQQALRGYVFAAYRMSDFMQTLNYSRNPYLALQIFDDEGYDSLKGGAQLALLHDTHPERQADYQAPLNEERELSFGGRTWLLRFESRQSVPLFSFQDPASIALTAGICLASLTGLLLWMLSTQGQRAMNLAQGMTQKLEQSEQIFRLAAEGANDGLWHRDFRQDSWFFSERALGLLGHPERAPDQDGGNILLSLLHPDDQVLLCQALEAHLRQRAPYDLELRLKRPDGSWGWFHLKGQATWDTQGTPLLMAGSISDIHDRKAGELELRQHRDRLQELVQERTQRLEGALREAREAIQAKSEFLANMSHELRTPLHAMLGFASIGLGKSEGNDKLHRYFQRIQQSAERLLSLVNDLLDLAKLEARKMEVRPRLQDVQPILQQVLGELDPLLQKKQLRVDLRLLCTHTLALVDGPRFAQVLHNLLSNAIRFSPEGGIIRINFSATQLPRGRRASDQGTLDALSLCVEDQGPGIPPDELEAIFDKFAQSSRTRTGAGGTGLGLAICQEIMAAHRGRIHAENSPLGGARLIAALPREGDAPPQEEVPS